MEKTMLEDLLKTIKRYNVESSGKYYFQIEKSRGTVYGNSAFLFVSFESNMRNFEIAVGASRINYNVEEEQGKELYKALDEKAKETAERLVREFIS